MIVNNIGFEAERTPPVADRQQEAAGSECSRPVRSEHDVRDWKAKPAAGVKRPLCHEEVFFFARTVLGCCAFF